MTANDPKNAASGVDAPILYAACRVFHLAHITSLRLTHPGGIADMNKLGFVSPVAVLTTLTALLLHTAADDAPKPVKPVNLACNTPADEDDPHISSNGLSLYYACNAKKKWDVMLSKLLPSSKWGAGKEVEGYVNALPDAKKPANARGVFLTKDGPFPQFLYFATDKNENDQKGDNFDLYVTFRNSAKEEFAPPEMVTVDTADDELHPWLTKEGITLTLYFSRKTKEGYRVFTAVCNNPKGGQGFAAPVLVDELPPNFHHVTLTPDGATMYLQGPLDNGRWGLFVSTKKEKKWGKPEPLELLNDPSGPTGDRSPCLSSTGTTLYFASDREGGKGGLDLYSVNIADLKKK